jgi:hypothetical protein
VSSSQRTPSRSATNGCRADMSTHRPSHRSWGRTICRAVQLEQLGGRVAYCQWDPARHLLRSLSTRWVARSPRQRTPPRGDLTGWML